MCMYVCMYVCMHVYTYTHIYTHTHPKTQTLRQTYYWRNLQSLKPRKTQKITSSVISLKEPRNRQSQEGFLRVTSCHDRITSQSAAGVPSTTRGKQQIRDYLNLNASKQANLYFAELVELQVGQI